MMIPEAAFAEANFGEEAGSTCSVLVGREQHGITVPLVNFQPVCCLPPAGDESWRTPLKFSASIKPTDTAPMTGFRMSGEPTPVDGN